MQKEKKVEVAVLLYILFLIIFVINNMINDINDCDIIYFGILICCMIRCIFVIKSNRK